jgi:hypothetical protein
MIKSRKKITRLGQQLLTFLTLHPASQRMNA